MKPILVLIFFLLSPFAAIPCFSQDDSEPIPLVAVPVFADRTGDHATRVVPGIYREKNVKVGRNTKEVIKEEAGAAIRTKSSRDVHEKQLERDIEFAPGDWKLPNQAVLVAADAVSAVFKSSAKFRILDRSTAGLSAIDEERSFAALSGADDSLIKICREKNAQYLVVGALTGFRIDEREGVVYGVRRRSINTQVRMDIRITDVASTEIVCQASPVKNIRLQLPEGVTKFTEVYDWEAVLREAVKEAASDMVTKLARVTGAEPLMEVVTKISISSDPPGADIVIDGDFVGNTPTDIEVPARRFNLQLKRQGYQVWENQVLPRENMKLLPALERLPEAPATTHQKQQQPN